MGWDGNDNRVLKGNGDIEVWFRYKGVRKEIWEALELEVNFRACMA